MSPFVRFPRKTLALGFAALLVPAGLLLAGARGVSQYRGSSLGGFHSHGAILGRIADKLDLTEGQKAEIREVFKTHRDELKGEIETMRAARQAQLEAIHADTFDEATIRGAAAKVGEAEAELAVMRGKIASEVRTLLTPDQRVKAKAMLKDAQASGREIFGHFRHRLDDELGDDSQR
jgi:Spy/CpxP family protein refolding chaperone